MQQTHTCFSTSSAPLPNPSLATAIQQFVLADQLCAWITAQDRITHAQDMLHSAALKVGEDALWDIEESELRTPDDVKLLSGFINYVVQREPDLPVAEFGFLIDKLTHAVRTM